MAVVKESPVWVTGITQIDPNDPVQGGAGGVDNVPHEQLANRTAYLKKEVEGIIGETTEPMTLESLLQRIKDLEDAPAITVPVLPIGATFETTVVYTSGAEVTAAIGYGIWQPFAAGRVTVGVSSDADDPSWTKVIGTEYGEYDHQLTALQIPEHKHSKGNLYNRFLARSSDVLAAANSQQYIGPGVGLTGSSYDNDNPTAEYQTGQMSNLAWTESEEVKIGGGQAHNNVQCSVVVGKWVRTA